MTFKSLGTANADVPTPDDNNEILEETAALVAH
jgi:hypothetical protein